MSEREGEWAVCEKQELKFGLADSSAEFNEWLNEAEAGCMSIPSSP